MPPFLLLFAACFFLGHLPPLPPTSPSIITLLAGTALGLAACTVSSQGLTCFSPLCSASLARGGHSVGPLLLHTLPEAWQAHMLTLHSHVWRLPHHLQSLPARPLVLTGPCGSYPNPVLGALWHSPWRPGGWTPPTVCRLPTGSGSEAKPPSTSGTQNSALGARHQHPAPQLPWHHPRTLMWIHCAPRTLQKHPAPSGSCQQTQESPFQEHHILD